jgi:hypothetical protein
MAIRDGVKRKPAALNNCRVLARGKRRIKQVKNVRLSVWNFKTLFMLREALSACRGGSCRAVGILLFEREDEAAASADRLLTNFSISADLELVAASC